MVVVGVAVPGGAGVVVAGAGGGGWVWAAGGTGSLAGPVRGGGGGPGAAVACLASPGGAGAVVAGLGVGVVYGRRGEGEVYMGRRWCSWWRPGERERRERGHGGLWWHVGERERREWVVEARWRCGECGRRGRVCRAGGGAGAPPFTGQGLIARVGPVRRLLRVLGGLAWCRLVLGGGVPRPRIRHVGV